MKRKMLVEAAKGKKDLAENQQLKRKPLQKSLWLRRMHLQNPQQRKGEDLRRSKHTM
jgi:hypothetical protein